MMEIINMFIFNTADGFIEAAPWLIFGFVVAGLIHVLIPSAAVKKMLSGEGFFSILKGSLIGIPLPLCSCSVIPVTRSLRQSGASIGASASFLTSTPQIGIDSFILTKALLGLPMAIVRVVVAFYSSLLAGLLVSKFGEDRKINSEVKSCCDEKSCEGEQIRGEPSALSSILRYSFITIPNDLSRPLVTGFIVAGLVATFLPVQSGDAAGGVLSQVIMMLIISIPTYTCAVSSTPIAQALFLKGIHPAAILVFLIAGPASNATTILAAREEFGVKGMLAYLFSLAFSSLTASFLVYYYFEDSFTGFTPQSVYHHHNHGQYTSTYLLSALVLCLIFVYAKVKERVKG